MTRRRTMRVVGRVTFILRRIILYYKCMCMCAGNACYKYLGRALSDGAASVRRTYL